ncbi:MAG: 50S ribosomal protein L18e [Candidatus Syntropharchaeia archaeon]
MRKTNPQLIQLINDLKRKSREEGVAIWRDIAKRLEKATRKRPAVNISKINRYTVENDVVVVPGKVLGSGTLSHPVTVAAQGFSGSALNKINRIGRAITIEALMHENPRGSGIKIIR